jgi:hypothetical protein
MALAARAATATRARATRIEEPASIDVMVGPSDGSRARRVDVMVTPGLEGRLEVGISLPPELRPTVMALLRALGVTAGRNQSP